MAAALVQLVIRKTGQHISNKSLSQYTGLSILADVSGNSNTNYPFNQLRQRRDIHSNFRRDIKSKNSNDNGEQKKTIENDLVEASTTKIAETGPKLDSLAESLASKGYLRSQKPYTPPTNVAAEIDSIVRRVIKGKMDTKVKLSVDDKFAILNECFTAFQHDVPNSQLYEIDCIYDIVAFYQTQVNTTLPLDAMLSMDLPKNLHIQREYVRFSGDSDAPFGSQTAFPASSTLVTGLKYRKKYQGYVAKRSWP